MIHKEQKNTSRTACIIDTIFSQFKMKLFRLHIGQ